MCAVHPMPSKAHLKKDDALFWVLALVINCLAAERAGAAERASGQNNFGTSLRTPARLGSRQQRAPVADDSSRWCSQVSRSHTQCSGWLVQQLLVRPPVRPGSVEASFARVLENEQGLPELRFGFADHA